MMYAAARVYVLVGVLFLEVEVRSVVLGLAAYKILKRLMSYLCHQTKPAIVFKQVAYFKCIHLSPPLMDTVATK